MRLTYIFGNKYLAKFNVNPIFVLKPEVGSLYMALIKQDKVEISQSILYFQKYFHCINCSKHFDLLPNIPDFALDYLMAWLYKTSTQKICGNIKASKPNNKNVIY